MDIQLSLFAMLGEYETPTIPHEEQKPGTIGWFVEVVRWVHDYTDDTQAYARIQCRARKVRLKASGSDNVWWDTVDYSDWYGGGTDWERQTLFTRYPTDADILRVAREIIGDDARAKGVPLEIERKPYRSDVED